MFIWRQAAQPSSSSAASASVILNVFIVGKINYDEDCVQQINICCLGKYMQSTCNRHIYTNA